MDIILVEGFKGEGKPKIEVYRSGVSKRVLSDPGELLAVVSDCQLPLPVPHFSFEDIKAIVELILVYVAEPIAKFGEMSRGGKAVAMAAN